MTNLLLVIVIVLLVSVAILGLLLFRTDKEDAAKTRIQKMVWTLYSNVLLDPELAPYFRSVSVTKIVESQTLMFRSLLLPGYEMPRYDLAKTHEHLNVTNSHFTLLMKHVENVLTGYGVSEEDRNRVLAALETYRNEIVKRKD